MALYRPILPVLMLVAAGVCSSWRFSQPCWPYLLPVEQGRSPAILDNEARKGRRAVRQRRRHIKIRRAGRPPGLSAKRTVLPLLVSHRDAQASVRLRRRCDVWRAVAALLPCRHQQQEGERGRPAQRGLPLPGSLIFVLFAALRWCPLCGCLLPLAACRYAAPSGLPAPARAEAGAFACASTISVQTSLLTL